MLVPIRETAQVRVTAVSGNAFVKFFVRQVLDQLREDGAACVHAKLFRFPASAENGQDFQIAPRESGYITLM